MTEPPPYVLGSDEAEIARLDAQAAMSAPATRLLLEAGGRISPGMRVLDLGTGLGHVAFDVAKLVGQDGMVVGIDQSTRLLEIAEDRRLAAGIGNIAFVEADVRTFQDADPFDAIVGRLILFFTYPMQSSSSPITWRRCDPVASCSRSTLTVVRSEPSRPYSSSLPSAIGSRRPSGQPEQIP